MLPVVKLALNNSVHASTGYTSFYINGLTHLRVSLMLPPSGSGLDGKEAVDQFADGSPATVNKQVSEIFKTRLNVLRYVCDAIAENQARQKNKRMLKAVAAALRVIRHIS